MVSGPARADDTNMQKLVDLIIQHFPYRGSQNPDNGTIGKPGTDWCFTAETDPTDNWWTFQDNYDSSGGISQISTILNKQATRIKMIFGDNDNGKIAPPYGFASIFLGLDFGGSTNSYATPASINQVRREFKQNPNDPVAELSARRPRPKPPHASIKSGIKFPKPDKTRCMSFKEFLKIVFTNTMDVTVSPVCPGDTPTSLDDTSCDPEDGVYPLGQYTRQTALGLDQDYPLFWNFNGRTHRIAGAFRVLVVITQKDQAGADIQTPAFLTIGYGGNSGPG